MNAEVAPDDEPTQFRTGHLEWSDVTLGRFSDFEFPTEVVETDAISPISLDAEDDATSAFREITIRAFGPSALAPLSLVRSQVVLVIE